MAHHREMAFDSRQPVRFADIDRAGIVYYPRFFDFWHRAFEDFFAAEVKVPYHEMIDRRRVGFPVVHVESDFRVPLNHGDLVTVQVTVARIGTTSVTMRFRTFRPTGELAAEGVITHVCVDMDRFQPRPLPDDVRGAFERHWSP
jgi:4-hydroxybenzoyl-CoA thioesterase